MDKEAVSMPGDKISEVLIDPQTKRVAIILKDGTYVIVRPDQRIIIVKDKKGEVFRNFDEFCEYVLKHTKLKVIKGGLEDETPKG